MLNIVQNLWKTLWRSLWIALGKLSTFLTKIKSAFTILWRKFSFTRILHVFCTDFYTEFISKLTVVRELDFHFYTEPITTITNNIKERI